MGKKSITSSQKSLNVIKWLKSGKGQRVMVIITFSMSPLLLLFVFTLLPFGKMIEFSFFNMKYIGKREFIGLQNYIDVFQREDIRVAIWNSLYYFIASFVQLALALYFATILSFNTKCKNLFKGTMFFPFLINGIAIGFIFKFFFTRGFVLDTILGWIGFHPESLPYWLKDMKVNNISLASTSVWRYMGQNMVLFIGAIQSVDKDMFEAAALDGANKWQQFRYIILPSIKTIVVLNMILSISGSLSAFEPPYVITGGSFGTSTYFVIMDRIAHANQKVGLASAMAVVLLTLIIIVTMIQKLISKYYLTDGTEYNSRKIGKKLKKQGGE